MRGSTDTDFSRVATEDEATVVATQQTQRVRLELSYDGTDFHGWARQYRKGAPDVPLVRTVQLELENALSLICRESIEVVVAGRTDAGVHAWLQTVHADLPLSVTSSARNAGGAKGRGGARDADEEIKLLVIRLNKLLPDDVSVLSARVVSENFNARFSALCRHYTYRLTDGPAGPSALRVRDTHHMPRDLDLRLMQAAADKTIGLHDFAGFSKQRPHATTVRNLMEFEWVDVSTTTEPRLYEANLCADAFCWHMVRGLVGVCIEIGRGARPLEFMDEVLASPVSHPKLRRAPAKGLALVGVDYPETEAGLIERNTVSRQKREKVQ